MTRDRWRRGLSHTIVALCAAAVLLALIPLALVLFYVVSQGITSLNLAFFTNMPAPVGEPGGGMGNAIVGSLVVTGLGAVFAIPIGIMSGIYAAEYAGTRLASAVRFAADTLNGVPSIVIGLFIYGIAVLPFGQFSALAGGLALGVMMIPLIMRTTEETDVTQPIATLTVQVYTYAISPYEDWHRQAWAGALVLVGIVFFCSLAARFATARLERVQRGS
ncbi:MAG: hypothetical protein LC804_19280 [Acidobacteria bacterium]|nr:hypothetical protein [Acidobacteriota bacterium]